MLGAIFGDMAGSVYEFANIRTTAFDLLGQGTTYTDDTILTVAVADWLLQGVLTAERLEHIIREYVGRYPHPMGGYGMRFNQWVRGEINGSYRSWGNGSAMRVAAVGWAFDTLEETESVAALTAGITHNHPEGIKGARATAGAIFLARNLATKQEIKAYIEGKYGYNLSRTCDEIRPGYSFDESCAGTVPEALIAFLDSRDFESAIRLAVSLGGDSDTLACITGGVAEAFYGMTRNLPECMESNHTCTNFEEKAKSKLPADLTEVVEAFYSTFVERNKVFWAKNESTTISGTEKWINTPLDDKVLDENSYRMFLKGFQPNWESRYGVYYEDGWNYVYRSYFLLKKFRFQKHEDGFYHLAESYSTEKFIREDLIECVLLYGYFKPPYRYRDRRF